MSIAVLGASRAGTLIGPAIRGLAAVGLAGILVGVPAGLVSRVIMKISALAAGPVVTGVHTSNGNAVGDFTADGVLALVIFAQRSRTARPVLLAMLAALLVLGAWVTGGAMRILLALAF